ncbi:MAG: hypothetical protein N3D18_02665 [Roseococcus sp.]|nr:hypothetical protein [Roseococcus sp.]
MGLWTRAMMAGLLGLGLVAAMPPSAEASGAPRPTAQGQRGVAPLPQMTRREAPPARPAPARPAVQGARGASAVPYAPARGGPQQAAASGPRLSQAAMAGCTVRNGRRACGPAARQTALRWTGGLAPAALSQTACPDGTIATTAIGHSNVVRCMPL